jgi:PTH1 family peptidyl-tRNA hydrolase
LKVIVGLGNPGRAYERTRHNVGWWALDHLADVWHLGTWKRDVDAVIASGTLGTDRVRLVKPQTYMNLSGAALRPYLGSPRWSYTTDLLVIVDEVALPLGTYRLRARGSAGGHNGLKSVEATLGSQDYARLRIGIQPIEYERGDLSDFVLSTFAKAEREVVEGLMPRVREIVECWIEEGVEKAMNKFNRVE